MGKKPREGIKTTILIVQLQIYLSKRCKSSQRSKYHLPSHTYTAPSDLDRQRLETHKPSLDTFGIPPKNSNWKLIVEALNPLKMNSKHPAFKDLQVPQTLAATSVLRMSRSAEDKVWLLKFRLT